ncbi:MAG: phospholipid scramblase-related protein, partial [Myxococcota bacterium]
MGAVTKAHCPLCAVTLALPAGRADAQTCSSCSGSFLEGEAALRLVRDDVGLAPALIPQLAAEGARSKLACPRCSAAMKRFVVKSVEIDWCEGCGGLWLDAKELSRLSRGKHEEPLGAPSPPHEQRHHGFASVPALHSEALLDEFVGSTARISIHGRFRWFEVLFGLEMANRYEVHTDAGTGYALESNEGLVAFLRRVFLGSHRPLDIDIYDSRERHTLTVVRPFYWFFSEARVIDAEDRLLGTVHRTFAFLWKRYELRDASGRCFARVNAPPWRFWKFPIVDESGAEVAVVHKRWSGFWRELYTDADRYSVELHRRPFTL